jgi:transcriptional regulator GlxA family with amidase domain
MEKPCGPDLTDLAEIVFDEKRQARCLPSNIEEHYMTKLSLSSVIRMAQSVAQREVQSPSRENTPAMKQAIESVLQMIEAKSGNGVEIQKLAKLVRQVI